MDYTHRRSRPIPAAALVWGLRPVAKVVYTAIAPPQAVGVPILGK
jgi:hypothetical protein